MPFNVTDFKSQVASKGFARAHSYDCIVTPAAGNGREISLRTESISAPGAAWMSVDNYKPYGNGRMYTLPYAFNPQEVSMVHTLDADYSVYQDFYEWANKVVDYKGDKQYTAYYLEEYARPLIIQMYDHNTGALKKTITLNEAFPLSVDQMQMSWGSSDDTLKLAVSYKYTDWKVS